jgi:hypothetical protein
VMMVRSAGIDGFGGDGLRGGIDDAVGGHDILGDQR